MNTKHLMPYNFNMHHENKFIELRVSTITLVALILNNILIETSQYRIIVVSFDSYISLVS